MTRPYSFVLGLLGRDYSTRARNSEVLAVLVVAVGANLLTTPLRKLDFVLMDAAALLLIVAGVSAGRISAILGERLGLATREYLAAGAQGASIDDRVRSEFESRPGAINEALIWLALSIAGSLILAVLHVVLVASGNAVAR